jgi:glyoxylase-like metal-dependent hydrolase (beta-lactamase superfamily II)
VAVKDCILLEDGTFDLDMGLLVWMKPQYYGKKYECAARSMLVVTGEDVILLDTGCGEVPERTVKEYNFKRRATLLQALERAGYPAGDVTIVINTHLHFDHCGWNRAFKNARFIVQDAELDYSQHPHKFQRDGYYKQFIEGTKFDLISGDHEVTEGVRILFTPGHTPGHQSVEVLWGKRHIVFCGDTGAVAENVLKRNVIGITTDPVKCLESIDRIRAIPDAFYVYAHDNQQAPLPKA